MFALRELNEGKAVQAGHKREIEELNTKKNQEISSLNSRLQQVIVLSRFLVLTLDFNRSLVYLDFLVLTLDFNRL